MVWWLRYAQPITSRNALGGTQRDVITISFFLRALISGCVTFWWIWTCHISQLTPNALLLDGVKLAGGPWSLNQLPWSRGENNQYSIFHCIPTYLSILKAALPYRPSPLPTLPFFGPATLTILRKKYRVNSWGTWKTSNKICEPSCRSCTDDKRKLMYFRMIYFLCLGYRRLTSTDLSMMTNCILERSSELSFRQCHWFSLFKAVFLTYEYIVRSNNFFLWR